MPAYTANRSSPNGKKLQSNPQTTPVLPAYDCSPICKRLAEGLELTRYKSLYFNPLLFVRNHTKPTKPQDLIICVNQQAYLYNTKLHIRKFPNVLKLMFIKKEFRKFFVRGMPNYLQKQDYTKVPLLFFHWLICKKSCPKDRMLGCEIHFYVFLKNEWLRD